MYFIAITGKANTGKNTLAKLLSKEIKSRCTKWDGVRYIAFADSIKMIVLTMFPSIPKKHLFGSSNFRGEIIPDAFKDGKPLTIRMALTDIGEGFKKYNSKIWINNFSKIFNKSFDKTLVICTDVRFREEFNYLKQLGFYQIKLIRETQNTNKIDTLHISETNQDDIKDDEFDFIINNNGTLASLKEQVKKIVDLIIV